MSPTFEEMLVQYDNLEQLPVLEYLNQLDEKQIKVLYIAQEHLGSSFHILKSNGYKSWLSEKTK